MLRLIVASSILAAVHSAPGVILDGHGPSLGSYGGDGGSSYGGHGSSIQILSAGHGLGLSGSFGDTSHHTIAESGGGGGSEGHGQGGGLEGGNSGGGDFHHGVSVLSIGGGKGQSFDLTDQGGKGHSGPFGGSFVASSKYSSGGHGGDWASESGSSGGGSGGAQYQVQEAVHYSDVLGASDSYGGGDAGHHSAWSK